VETQKGDVTTHILEPQNDETANSAQNTQNGHRETKDKHVFKSSQTGSKTRLTHEIGEPGKNNNETAKLRFVLLFLKLALITLAKNDKLEHFRA